MKILDRYISLSVAASFCFGVTMFMVLLLAMSLMKDLIDLIAEKGIPVGTALAIFGYQIPSMLTYAFPMSVLLGILLTFSRMSADSEMVAIRAGGVSFVRIVVPTLLVALVVTGLTFWIADVFAPFAGQRAVSLTETALREMRQQEPLQYMYQQDGEIIYVIVASDLDVQAKRMTGVQLIVRQQGQPSVNIDAEAAVWSEDARRWEFIGASFTPTAPTAPHLRLLPNSPTSSVALELFTEQVKQSPFVLDASRVKKRPQNYTAREMRKLIDELVANGEEQKVIGKWRMGLAQRYAVPFASLVFALIGAPLGLRHHRTSSAVGLGVSLLVIFAFYSIATYMSSLGESGLIAPNIAAWTPNVLGSILGIFLIVKANQ